MSRLSNDSRGRMLERMKQFDKIKLGNGTITQSTFNVTADRGEAGVTWGEPNYIEGVITSNLFQIAVTPHATQPKILRLYSDQVLKFGGTKTTKIYIRNFKDLIDEATNKNAQYILKQTGAASNQKIVFGEIPNGIAQTLGIFHQAVDWNNAPQNWTADELSKFLYNNIQGLTSGYVMSVSVTFHFIDGGGTTKSYIAWGESETTSIYGSGNTSMTFSATDKEYEVAYDLDQHKGQATDFTHGGLITTRVVQRVR